MPLPELGSTMDSHQWWIIKSSLMAFIPNLMDSLITNNYPSVHFNHLSLTFINNRFNYQEWFIGYSWTVRKTLIRWLCGAGQPETPQILLAVGTSHRNLQHLKASRGGTPISVVFKIEYPKMSSLIIMFFPINMAASWRYHSFRHTQILLDRCSSWFPLQCIQMHSIIFLWSYCSCKSLERIGEFLSSTGGPGAVSRAKVPVKSGQP